VEDLSPCLDRLLLGEGFGAYLDDSVCISMIMDWRIMARRPDLEYIWNSGRISEIVTKRNAEVSR
jgi:hypothetical protein